MKLRRQTLLRLSASSSDVVHRPLGYGKYVQHERQKTRNVNERKLNKVLEQT